MDTSTDSDRILVGVDGSASSIAALRYAARIADAFDAPIEAVITWTYPPFSEPAYIAEWSPELDAREVLDGAIAMAFDGNPPSLTRTVLTGPPARTLIRLSENASMLVLGSRGHGGFVGLLLGSVSAACAEHAHCPVLVVRAQIDPARDAPDEA